MNDETGLPKLKYLGSYEGGSDRAIVIPREALERPQAPTALERELAAAAKAAAAKAADEARIRDTKRTRVARRFRKALRMWRR